MLKTIFMGSPQLSVEFAEQLRAHTQLQAVFCQPPQPSGRGQQLQLCPVHAWAQSHHLPIFTPASLKSPSAQKDFLSIACDVAVVVAYGLMLPKPILQHPRLGCVNVHFSILPRWRGAAPFQHGIWHGDDESGVSITLMGEGLDDGPQLAQSPLHIRADDTSGSLLARLVPLGTSMLMPTLDGYANGRIQPQPQTTTGITFAPKIKKSDGRLDFSKTAHVLERQVRAFTPWPTCFVSINQLDIKVHAATVTTTQNQTTVGTIIDDRLTIQCANQTALQLTRVQRPGGKILDVAEFLRGFSIQPGTIVSCPATN